MCKWNKIRNKLQLQKQCVLGILDTLSSHDMKSARTHAGTMSKSQCYQTGASHPYAHRLRLKPSTSYIQSYAPERSLTVTNLTITPRTAFEMERPQTRGSPHLVVINTSFRTAFPDKNSPRKRIPTFPKLATDPSNRQTNVSRQTNSSMATTRKLSSRSTFRRDTNSANIYANSARMSIQERENSSRSDRRPGQRIYLTQRQTNTFAAYAKYNDIVQSTKARERAIESPITTNINDLSALIPEKRTLPQEVTLSNEKHLWISDWIASTSAAMRLEDLTQEEPKVTKTLSVIHEQ